MFSQLLLPDLQQLLQEDDADGLREFGKVFHPAATAEVLSSLSSADVWRVLSYKTSSSSRSCRECTFTDQSA